MTQVFSVGEKNNNRLALIRMQRCIRLPALFVLAVWFWMHPMTGNAARDAVFSNDLHAESPKAVTENDEFRRQAGSRFAGDAHQQLLATLTLYSDAISVGRRIGASGSLPAGWHYVRAMTFRDQGDIQLARGHPAKALASYRKSLSSFEHLADAEPGSEDWQFNLMISYNKIGNVLFEQGDLAAAMENYRADFDVVWALSTRDPNPVRWHRDLAIVYGKFGDVFLAKGLHDKALENYRSAFSLISFLQTREREQNVPPEKREAGTGALAYWHNKIGNVHTDAGRYEDALGEHQKALAIRKASLDESPDDKQRLFDLSIALDNIADLLVKRKDINGALGAYRRSHDLMQRLVDLEPENKVRQRDLMVSFWNLSDALLEQPEPHAAEKSLARSLILAEQLAAADNQNISAQYDLWWARRKMGRLQNQKDRV